jgi:hypothetical protein
MECKNNMIVKFDDGTCILEAGIPAKFGKDLQASALTVKPCADTICDVCSDNYLMCTQCPSATALLAPDLGKCYLLSDLSSMPHKYGKKSDGNSGYKLARCYDNKCIDCYENYSKCTVCEISHIVDGFSRCIFKSRGTIGKATVRAPVAKLVTIPMFERSRNTFGFSLVGKKLTPAIVDYFVVNLKTPQGKVYTDQNNFDITIVPRGITVAVKIDESYSQSSLIIDRVYKITLMPSGRILSSTLTAEEEATLDSISLPFEGTIMSNYGDSSIQSINSFKVYTKIGVALRIISNILLPFDSSSRVAAYGMDRMFSHFTLATVQASENYVMSRMALRLIQVNRRAVLPFLNLDSNRDNENCQATTSMLLAGEDCDFTVNYGDNAMGLAIILGFMIIIDLVFVIIRPRISNSIPFSVSFFIYAALKTFGIRFFLAKIESVSMEVVYHFFINVYTLNASNTGGFILGIIMTIYILSQALICIFFVRKLLSLTEEQISGESISSDKDLVRLAQIAQPSDHIIWKTMSIMWVGMRAQIGKHAVYYPIVSMIRMFLLGLIVGLLTEHILAMGIIVIVIDGAFLLYQILFTKLRPRIGIVDNIIEVLGPVFNIIYYLLSIISTVNKLDKDAGYDTYLYIIVLAFMLVNILLVLTALLLSGFKLSDG